MKIVALRALVALLFCFFSIKNMAQCPVMADAGPDIHYCQGDPNPQLEGSVVGDALSFVWAPPAGLSSTTVLDPTVTITAMKTYTLTANGLQDNSILNGDFESGNSNFNTSYIYDPVSLWLESRYTVTDNPNSVHPNFAACSDHTSGSGQMMVVNGSATAGAVVWGQTVTVQPNMTYRFSYWGCSVISASPAQQIFRINGVNIGSTFTYPAATCQWQQFFVIWNSGAATSANLQLINQNTAASGNDFAIDDINFQKQCSDIDSVTVFYHPDALKTVTASICNGDTYTVGNETFDASGNYLVNLQTSFGCDSLVQLNLTVINIDAEINPSDPVIDCQNPTVWLTSQGSVVPPGTQYLWTTAGGQIIGNPGSAQVTAGSIGSYFLKLTYKNGLLTCIDTTSVVVTSAAALPVANAGPDMTIGCATPTATLAGSFTGGANFTANWTTPNGHFVSGQTTFSPIVDAAGMYILTVTNPTNGCSDKDTVMVTQDLNVPISNAGTADTIDCATNSIVLNGTASTGPNFVFAWSTLNGNFVGGTNTLNPTVNQAGQYFLLVSNTQNGCTAISSVTIAIDTIKPDAHAGQPFTLDCLVSFDTIFGSSATNFPPVWSTVGGHFVSGQNTLEPVVDEAGIYTLTISNPINHCKSMVSVEILKNTTLPVVDAGPTFLLTCTNPTATLSGTQTSGGPSPQINWTTIGGSFLSGETTLNPIVGTPGTYILTVVNPQNGCSASDQTTVTADPNIPAVTIAMPDTLNCVLKNQQLQATTSGANFQINWTTTTGNIIDGGNTLTPNIDEQGIYVITVVNPANGCSATNSVEVFEDKILPLVVIDPTSLIDCNNAGSLLNATNSSQGPSFSYNWTTVFGQILSGQNSLIAVAGKAGTYVLTIVNNDNGCSAMKLTDVYSNLSYPTADAGADKTLGCLLPTIDLTAVYNSNSPNSTILWSTTTGGTIANPSSITINVDQAGVYVFTVINNQNGCSAADSVEVFQDNNTPVVMIPQPGLLTCAISSTVLQSTGSSFGNNFTYNWTTTDGNIISASDTSFVEINKIGQYTLTVLNTTNGCKNSETVTVSNNITPPPVDAGPAQVLDCQTTSLALIGLTTSGFQPAWTTQNGHILNGANSLSAQIDAAGWYFFTATNPANGCSATDSVQVLPDAGAPVLTVGVSGIITCLVQQVQINSTATSTSGNTNFQIDWTSPTGQFVSGQNSLTPIVNKPGNYLLSVKDLVNGCVSNTSINVVADIAPPQILLTAPQEITCANPTPSIVGVINTIGNDYDFQWSTTNGQLVSGLNSLMPTVDKIGTYILMATDNSNGCTASQSVLVNENIQLPEAVLAQPEPLTCLISSVSIDGSQSDSGINYSIELKTIGGNFLTGQNGLNPTVDKTGFYILTIKNLINGCTKSDTIEVLENKIAPTVSINKPDTITCKINSVPITSTGAGQGILSAIWTTTNGQISGPANQLNINANKVGNYSIKITDAENGCTATAQITVFENKIPPAIVVQNPGKLTCKDSILTVFTTNSALGSPYSWDWSGAFLSLADTLKPKIDKTGQYSLTITDEHNGCKSTQSITVSSDFTPPPIDMGNPMILTCAEPTAFLGGATSPGGQVLFNWTTLDGNILGSSTSGTVEVDAVGTYFLTTTSIQNGCTATGTVEVTETKLTGANFESKSPTCAGNLGHISVKNMAGGTLPYRFSVDGGQNWQQSPEFLNLQPGNYPIAVEDAGGCRIDLAAFISPGSTIEINLEKEAEISLGGSYILSATTNVPTTRLDIIQWTPDTTLSCGDCLKTIASPLETTRYRLFVADTSGCDAEAYFLLKVVRPPVFAPNVLKNDGNFSVNSHFTVFTDADAVLEVKKLMVFDRWGNVVFQQKNFPPNDPALGWPGDFRGKQMGNAVYVWWAEIVWIDGKTSFLKGDVTIVD